VRVVIITVACEFSLAHVAMEYVDLKLDATATPANDLIMKRQLEWKLSLLILHLHNHKWTVGCGDLSHVSL
jgi:hypothetical protein